MSNLDDGLVPSPVERAKIRVHGAAGLSCPNKSSGDINPYFLVRLNGVEIYRSRVIRETSSPAWNSDVALPVLNGRSTLQLCVFDQGRRMFFVPKSTLLGNVDFGLWDVLNPAYIHPTWFRLRGNYGHIQLSFGVTSPQKSTISEVLPAQPIASVRPSNILVFKISDIQAEASAIITLSNNLTTQISYSILVTNPHLFRVRPANGKLVGLQEQKVEVRLMPGLQSDLSLEHIAIFFESQSKIPEKLQINLQCEVEDANDTKITSPRQPRRASPRRVGGDDGRSLEETPADRNHSHRREEADDFRSRSRNDYNDDSYLTAPQTESNTSARSPSHESAPSLGYSNEGKCPEAGEGMGNVKSTGDLKQRPGISMLTIKPWEILPELYPRPRPSGIITLNVKASKVLPEKRKIKKKTGRKIQMRAPSNSTETSMTSSYPEYSRDGREERPDTGNAVSPRQQPRQQPAVTARQEHHQPADNYAKHDSRDSLNRRESFASRGYNRRDSAASRGYHRGDSILSRDDRRRDSIPSRDDRRRDSILSRDDRRRDSILSRDDRRRDFRRDNRRSSYNRKDSRKDSGRPSMSDPRSRMRQNRKGFAVPIDEESSITDDATYDASSLPYSRNVSRAPPGKPSTNVQTQVKVNDDKVMLGASGLGGVDNYVELFNKPSNERSPHEVGEMELYALELQRLDKARKAKRLYKLQIAIAFVLLIVAGFVFAVVASVALGGNE